MRRLLPSTAALAAFEAAAQYLSFTRAGKALGMTQSGISRQVGNLETQLGTPLFERIGPRLQLTENGKTYAEDISRLLAEIDAVSVDVVRGSRKTRALLIGVQDSLASSWLARRLPRFVAGHPEDDYFHIVPVRETATTLEEEHDISILRGHGAWREAHSSPLFDEEVAVVAAPALVAPGETLTMEALAEMPKLQASHRHDSWLRWYDAKGIRHGGRLQGPRFAQTSAMIEAAAAGLGLAVVPMVMVEPHLADGRLHLAAGGPVCSGMGYFAVYPEQNAHTTRVRHFRDWIIAETRPYRRGAHHVAASNSPSERVAEGGTKTPSSLDHAPLVAQANPAQKSETFDDTLMQAKSSHGKHALVPTGKCPLMERLSHDVAAIHGYPEEWVHDNGPDLTSRAMFEWPQRTRARLRFIQPGKPTQNACVDSFNGKFRDECRNENWFASLGRRPPDHRSLASA